MALHVAMRPRYPVCDSSHGGSGGGPGAERLMFPCHEPQGRGWDLKTRKVASASEGKTQTLMLCWCE